MTWLVTGGAGYIGAHVVSAMRDAGESVVILDDLSSGRRARVSGFPSVVGSVIDQSLVAGTLRAHAIRGIVHLAAKKAVEETPCVPITPYGRTKMTGDGVVTDVAAATGLRYASLRYFNVAGPPNPRWPTWVNRISFRWSSAD